MTAVSVIIEKSGMCYSAYMAEGTEILGYSIIGEGSTVEDAIADFKDSYKEIRDYCIGHGDSFCDADFAFRFKD